MADLVQLDRDVMCAGCSYNLRTLTMDASCPECGHPVIDSVNSPNLRAFGPIWHAVFVGLIISTCLFLTPFTCIGPNLGLPFGYYGKLNRVVSTVDALPGVDVVGVRMHRENTLEHFAIDVLVDGEHDDSLHFSDWQPIGDMLLVVDRWNRDRHQ